MDVVNVSLFGNAYALGAKEDHGLLLRAEGGVGYDEGHGGLVGVVLGVGEANTELSGHSFSFRGLFLLYPIVGMVGFEEASAGEPAPGWDVFIGTEVLGAISSNTIAYGIYQT